MTLNETEQLKSVIQFVFLSPSHLLHWWVAWLPLQCF
jgi:hypothetical protein